MSDSNPGWCASWSCGHSNYTFTVVTIVYLLGIMEIEKIISGIVVANKSRWGTVGLALIFGSMALGYRRIELL